MKFKFCHGILDILKNCVKKSLNKTKILFKKCGGLKTIFKFARLIIVLLLILESSILITKKLSPSDYTIRFKRECDVLKEKCEKIKERNLTIENEINNILSTIERLDFFTRFTFLRFDFQITNQSQFNLIITKPYYEERINIMMQCNLNGQDYVLPQNTGIIFEQKSSIQNIISGLDIVQNVLIKCNPAPQSIANYVGKPLAPGGEIKIVYNEEKYYLKFLPDKWNLHLTIFQVFVAVGIIFGAIYEILKFIKKGFSDKQ